MTITVQSHWDAGKTEAGYLARCRKAEEMLGREVLASSTQYVPYDTGRLASGGTAGFSRGGRMRVIWRAPYAKAVYYGDRRGIRLKRERNPRASFYWFEAAKQAELVRWTADIAKVIGGGSQDR